jgi:transposase
MGDSKHYYNERQKAFALSLVDTLGVRKTAKVLCVSRSTIQRWCRQYGKPVSRYPAWLYEWARKRVVKEKCTDE